MGFLATIHKIHRVVEFNSLTLPLQIVAILIMEEAYYTALTPRLMNTIV